MSDPFATLVASADRVVPGQEANTALWDAHERMLEKYGQAINYEIVVATPPPKWDVFLTREMVKLLDHLDAKRAKPPSGPGLCVGFWMNDELHIFEEGAFFERLAEIECSDVDTFIDRVRVWRAQRDAGTEGVTPLLLPPQA